MFFRPRHLLSPSTQYLWLGVDTLSVCPDQFSVFLFFLHHAGEGGAENHTAEGDSQGPGM